MKIAFPCESCGHRFEVDGALAGKKCKCKQCGHVFLIPVPRQPAQATARPARTFDPYADVDDDPYAVDDTFAPAAHEDDEFLPPRGSKPVATLQTVRKKKKTRSESSAWDAAPWWVVKIGGGLTLVSALCCVFSVQVGLSLVSVFYFGTALILFAMGGLGITIVPFLESAACGLMNLFVPVYPLYYLVTRWDAMKRWFLTYLAGFLLFIPGLLFFVGFPVIDTVRDATRVAQLRAEIDAAGPNDPRRAEREAEAARLEAKLKGELAETPKPFLPPASGFDPPATPAPESPRFVIPPESAPKFPEPPGFDVPSGSTPAPATTPAAPPPSATPSNGFEIPTPTPSPSPAPAPAARSGPPPLPPSDPNFVPQVLTDLKAAEPARRKEALGRLAEAAASPARRLEVAEAVEPLLSDPKADCRAGAAKALGAWGGAKNTPALVKALKDPEVTVREAVLDALAVVKDPGTAEAVAARLVDTRDRAAAALRAIGRPAETAAMKYLTHEDIWVRTEACKVLEDVGGSDECKKALAGVVERANGFGFDADAANSALQKLGAGE